MAQPSPDRRAETYRERAKEALALAASTANPEHRRMWERISDEWEQLAGKLAEDGSP